MTDRARFAKPTVPSSRVPPRQVHGPRPPFARARGRLGAALMLRHGYWRSGTAYRAGIALSLKGIACRRVTHDRRRAGHGTAEFRAVEPQWLVRVLAVHEDVLIQSPAILEWLKEGYPAPSLLPATRPTARR